MNLLLAEGNSVITGVITFFLGMITVFLGIAILVFVVWAVGKILAVKKKEPKSNELEGVVTDDTVDGTASYSSDTGVTPEIAAVITAAIAAYYQSAESAHKCEFKVKKIKRRS